MACAFKNNRLFDCVFRFRWPASDAGARRTRDVASWSSDDSNLKVLAEAEKTGDEVQRSDWRAAAEEVARRKFNAWRRSRARGVPEELAVSGPRPGRVREMVQVFMDELEKNGILT